LGPPETNSDIRNVDVSIVSTHLTALNFVQPSSKSSQEPPVDCSVFAIPVKPKQTNVSQIDPSNRLPSCQQQMGDDE
jgi:hypothetical protein